MAHTSGKQIIVITSGDPAGIGPDICLQLAECNYFYQQQQQGCQIWILGDFAVFAARAALLNIAPNIQRITPNTFDKVALPSIVSNGLPLVDLATSGHKLNCIAGQPSAIHSGFIMAQLKLAAGLCLANKVHAMVTAPVSKNWLQKGGIDFVGHTEWLAKFCGVPQTVMSFIAPKQKYALATTHIPLAQVSTKLTQTHLLQVIQIVATSLRHYWGISTPTIGVLGLNPHAGEAGTIGQEELTVIQPVIKQLKQQGKCIIGPVAADSFFLHPDYQQVDLWLGLYHDQILPLVKFADFSHTVNLTLGLPIIRTSVDHGTAFALAGSGKSDPANLQSAIDLAAKLGQTRLLQMDDTMT